MLGIRCQSVPADVLPRFFQVLGIGQAVAPGGELGLSLPLAQRILSLFGGGVTAENMQPDGLTLTARFKCPPAINPGEAPRPA